MGYGQVGCGVKPQPAALRVLRGNPGRRPINEQELNIPIVEDIECPEWAQLNEGGKEVWNRVAKVLYRNKLLTDLDVEGVIRYCDMVEKWYRVKKFLDKNGFSYPVMEDVNEKIWEVDVNGSRRLIEKKKEQRLKSMIQFPEVSIYHKLEAAITKKEQEYGMTPVARTRIYSLLNGVDRGMELDDISMSNKAMRFAR